MYHMCSGVACRVLYEGKGQWTRGNDTGDEPCRMDIEVRTTSGTLPPM
ncbi:hypothetical protein M513_14108 [Trichuris suis]|uniref:Uncharacterized protein n=1 Tax=Trichuris suis TaxID=68888 RepID=A0A085LJ69_9BILA|nr:hypothetical protein M513_14108 [Trichuris suis]